LVFSTFFLIIVKGMFCCVHPKNTNNLAFLGNKLPFFMNNAG
jgi:hypothetical protein